MDTSAPEAPHAAAEWHVTALYQAHALSLARLALLMLGDPDAAQDVVQDAFLGLYRRWDKLTSAGAAPAYLRTSVLNGCRTLLKRRSRPGPAPRPGPPRRSEVSGCRSRRTRRSRPPPHAAGDSLESAEAALMHTEEQR